ncbi:hypothetical protein ACEXQD_14490 [Herbiconiux sp. P15]|uniref:hypothetical protein n=1 Tax=Herbiconiux liukaitaii TaxID=3342799 RepID=UPI0035B92AA7
MSVLIIIGGALATCAVLIVSLSPSVFFTAKRASYLRVLYPDSIIFSFASTGLANKYFKTLPRLDGRDHEFLPSYYTAVASPHGLVVWAGWRSPRRLFDVPSERIASVTPGRYAEVGKIYRGLVFRVFDASGTVVELAMSPLRTGRMPFTTMKTREITDLSEDLARILTRS